MGTLYLWLTFLALTWVKRGYAVAKEGGGIHLNF